MTANLRVIGLEQSAGFAEVARNVVWEGDRQPADLCVAMSERVGFLALSERPNMARSELTDLQGALIFTDLHPEWSQLPVPSTIADVASLTGKAATLDNPHLAKGLGVLGCNTVAALASHYAASEMAAARVIPIEGIGDVYVGPNYSLPQLAWRGGQHKVALRRANRGDDKSANDEWPSTEQALIPKAREFGGRVCALLALSPINVIEQTVLFPPQKVRGAHVLASGGVGTPSVLLERVGMAQIPKPRNYAAARVLNLLTKYL